MQKIHKRSFIRNESREMYLYGYNVHTEIASEELKTTLPSKPHLRWSTPTQERVTYSAGR